MSSEPSTVPDGLVGPRVPVTVDFVRVQELHGTFSYSIDCSAHPFVNPTVDPPLLAVNEDRLTLLYGNNGSGKTSLLRLLFHALSAAPDKGHRTALFNTRFASLIIGLSNGTTVAYLRDGPELTGPYRASIARGNDESVSWNFISDRHRAELRHRASEYWISIGSPDYERHQMTLFEDEESSAAFLSELASFEINPVFLSDSRSITSDVLAEDTGSEEFRMGQDRFIRAGSEGSGLKRWEVDSAVAARRSLDVHEALARVRAYLAQLAFQGTQAGSQRADTVYQDVAATIADHEQSHSTDSGHYRLGHLRRRIENLGADSEPYSRYGLLPQFAAETLLGQISGAKPENGHLLEQVLTPYIAGHEQRLQALRPGLSAVRAIVDALNSFLERKTVTFVLGSQGLRITDDSTGEPLDAGELSSGEKQIVLLFSDIVALQGMTHLFVIDEPELSLNPHWQRQLMPSLLSVTEHSGMQLIVATHSIEIMAKYRSRIRPLDV